MPEDAELSTRGRSKPPAKVRHCSHSVWLLIMNDFPSEDRDTELVGLGLPAIDCFACSACRRGYLTRAEKLRRGQMAKKKTKHSSPGPVCHLQAIGERCKKELLGFLLLPHTSPSPKLIYNVIFFP